MQNPFQSLIARLIGSGTGPNLPLNLDAEGNLLVSSQSSGQPTDVAAAAGAFAAGALVDGADTTQGTEADAAWSGSGSGTVVAILKAIWAALTGSNLNGGSFTHVAANGNGDALKSGAGVLIGINVNTKGATANVLTVYDSLTHGSGTTIAVIDTTAGPATWAYNLKFTTGLSYSLATGTAADVTLVWR